ncbi:WD repeat-containing protein 81-like [Pecten maximus]|uniref:WD repeat-containing protein 81-like n=1 Tax=Pecten maximus TaxID=6579 RepID=UPI0014591A8E|nr:WD repeat-containing protein 81-like [Pecten maximus]
MTSVSSGTGVRMEHRDEISRALNIPREYTRRISKTRVVCLVSDDWLQLALQGNVDGHKWGHLLTVPECDRLLALSTGTTQHPWLRISVKSILKSDQLIDWPQDEAMYNPELDASLLGHLSETSKENFQNLWRSAYERYHGGEEDKMTHRQTQFTEAVRQYLQQIHPQAYNSLNKHKNHQVDPPSDRLTVPSTFLQNTVPILTIVETDVYFHLIQPYFAQSLHDVVTFSPSIFESSFSKPLFVLYQILQSMRMFHKHGLSAGDLNMRNILIDHKLWVYLANVPVGLICPSAGSGGSQDSDTLNTLESQPATLAGQTGDQVMTGPLLQRLRSESDTMVEDARKYLQSSQNLKFEIKYLPDFVEQWVNRKISNFRYLMVLNTLAGRRAGDPNHHPVLPWVMDFSGPDYGFRDLKKSKYRLNKGDNQLDLTYEAFSGLSDDSHIPHHVSDVLSDITYYVYKARRTPKSILCTHVRSRWVPNEYPSSMQRMQEWTPDECIPEFFTDPTIFTSMHEDLPDLELPPWSKTAEDFISKHMEVLESEQVSSCLHHWVDLTFGFKLTGSAAVKSKNVNLQLVDEHKHVTNRGVVQLFNVPHPHRTPVSQRTGHKPPRLLKNMLPSQVSIYMEHCLPNDDMIRQLCSQYDGELSPTQSSDSEPPSPVHEATPVLGIGSNVALLGNRIQLTSSTAQGSDAFKVGPIHRNSRILRVDPDETRIEQKEHQKRRHLRGNWLAYWEHELGLSERDTMFNFKQIKLQTFEGHSSSIRSLTVLDNENSFITASKDKTVKLWSIKSYGDGAHKSKCQWTYQHHKKSVFSVAYLESVRLVASCDSTVHIWDPFTGDIVRRLESSRYSPVTALIPCPSPSTMIITATNDSTLRFLDLRAASYAHEYKCTTSTAGLIRCVTVSPDSHWVSVGFSSGMLSIIDLRTGIMMKSWKGHEGDILQMKAYNKTTFLTSSFDQTMKIWNTEDSKDLPCLKGQSEPVHCMSLYKNQIISGTTGNKIGVHASIENQASFTVTKLKADTFKGVLTSMAILPMNRTVLLGADNGSVRLLC